MAKKKLKRFKENEAFPHVIEPKFIDLKQNNFQLKGLWSSDFFENNNPIILELGCGKGEYTVGLAQENKSKNYIGVDIKGARLWRGAKTAFEAKMKHVAFLRTRVDFIDFCFGENEVSEIWCTFSDPYLGHRKNIKKRLTSSSFLSKYQQIIKDKGLVHLKTDDPVLYAYTQDVIKHNDLKLIHDISDIYKKDYSKIVPPIKTFYEKMWLEENRTIRYLCFELPKYQQITEPPINEAREGFTN
ncbi:MAG: tRNA (guanosine(46)-N7)-methyltransferase TrmB [Bacteroidota bacterium]|nr:tRNA (guanosine(46)-N7)-methyltransferase TrmB [Bacteroidota bacterium]